MEIRGSVLFLFALSLAAQDFRNPGLDPEKRAADLVSRLTLEEKVLQMQNSAPAVPRLGIPAYDWWNEALHGVAREGVATVFPQAIGLAATWNTDLMHRIADTISTEARAKYHEALRQGDHSRYHGLTFWSPNINIFRDPRWGRGQETYGEDPYLTGRLAVAFVTGMQGTDPHYLKVVATPKHYAVHSGPEPVRHGFDVRPSERDLNETYLAAFRMSIQEGHAYSVMCAYNAVYGIPACANPDLLGKLREWGFRGYITSDCGAVDDIKTGHKYKATIPEAAAAAVKAGTDVTCGDEYASLVDAVKQGFITEEEINRSLERLFVARFRLGMFDPPERVPYARIPITENDSAEHRQLALEAARQSIVLLKNERDVLPLRDVRSMAVIGPGADDPDAPLANYFGIPSRLVTPLEGLRKQFPKARIRAALASTYTAQTGALVPPQVLNGLKAEYFDNADLQGEPRLKRPEARVAIEYDQLPKTVRDVIPRQAYSVRWTGTLRSPFSGEIPFGAGLLSCDDCKQGDSTRVYLDGKEIVGDNSPRAANARIREGRATLEAGKTYQLRVEYRRRAGDGTELFWTPPEKDLLREAVEAVKQSDIAVAFVGLNGSLEGEEMGIKIPGFAGGDRTDLKLPEPQERLLEAAVATGKPLMVVLLSGSALAANFAQERAAAVLEAWYGGEEAGTAIAQTLAGVNNPAGRLPLTFYHSVDQLPPFADYNMKGRTYRYFEGQPLYRFGYGLSYSRFHYAKLNVKDGKVSVSVKNDSARAGDEVVQLYVSGQGDAIRTLRGFERIHLRPGEAREVSFPLSGHGRLSVGGGQPGPNVVSLESEF